MSTPTSQDMTSVVIKAYNPCSSFTSHNHSKMFFFSVKKQEQNTVQLGHMAQAPQTTAKISDSGH
jgi:hypothetical protein